MDPAILRALRARAPFIRKHWDTLLHVEPVNGPLANPDTLAHLIPSSLEQIFQALSHPVKVHALPAPKECLIDCHCGNNPYIAYFIAGEQALVEALVLVQVGLPQIARTGHDLAEVQFVVRHLARDEIDGFCGICVHRGTARGCRHALAAG
ncbi:MAG: hypothetical protein HZA93_14385 [Verrucomicrobia bacterium]|nr:hypothetical protein [Verrucomicrobiota bacterium]